MPEVTQPGRASLCPRSLSTILPLCPIPRAPALPLEALVAAAGAAMWPSSVVRVGGRVQAKSGLEETDYVQRPYLTVPDVARE